MICTRGDIFLEDLDTGFGYVAQSPWLQRGTIRDNILWGAVYEETRYRNVLYACALQDDLEVLGGDLVGVGEAGRTLSGGQRARVALARAVYQDKQIYLFDDILSSLDAHVTNHVIKHCILGLLKSKTRIIVSEHSSLLQYANQLLHIENGIITQGNLKDLSLSDDQTSLEYQNAGNQMMNIKLSDPNGMSDETDSILKEETKEQGTLSSNVFLAYWKAMSSPLALAVLISVIAMQSSRNLSDVWLAHWVDRSTFHNSSVLPHSDTTFYLSIYSGLVTTNSFLTLIRAFIFAYAGIRAAMFIHLKLLNSVFYVSIKFLFKTLYRIILTLSILIL